jgi:hypothetical protein
MGLRLVDSGHFRHPLWRGPFSCTYLLTTVQSTRTSVVVCPHLAIVIARGIASLPLQAIASIGVQYSDAWIPSHRTASRACGGQKVAVTIWCSITRATQTSKRSALCHVPRAALPCPFFAVELTGEGEFLIFTTRASCLAAQEISTMRDRTLPPLGRSRCLPGRMVSQARGLSPTYGPATAAELPMECTASFTKVRGTGLGTVHYRYGRRLIK